MTWNQISGGKLMEVCLDIDAIEENNMDNLHLINMRGSFFDNLSLVNQK